MSSDSDAILAQVRRAGGEAYSIPCRGRLDPRVVRWLVNFIRRQQIDILHTHEPKSRLYGAIAAWRSGVPQVTTLHGWTRNGFVTTLVEALDILSLRLADRIVAVSSGVAGEIQRAGIRAKKIEVIPNGIDFVGLRVNVAGRDLRASLGLAKVPVVGAVGSLDGNKGHSLLLEAARLVADAGVDASYLIVGDGAEKQNLESLARNLGLSDRVRLAGYQSNVAAFYRVMDLFVLTSYREGTPMVLLEAMAMGKPVISMSVGGVPDVVAHSVHGFLLKDRTPQKLAAAILQLLREPKTAKRLAEAGCRRIEEEFSASRMAERYERVYTTLISNLRRVH